MEPIAALGAISFIFASLNFLLTTASNLRKRYLEFKEAERRFEFFKYQLLACQSSLQVWDRHWIIPDATRSTYETLWGSDSGGAREIYSMRSHIKAILRFQRARSGSLSPHDVKLWIEYVKKAGHTTYNIGEATLKRICLALYRHDELQEKFARLRTAIQDLEGHSNRRWVLKHGGGTSHTPTREERDRLRMLLSSRTLLSEWYDSLRALPDAGKWALELRLPHRTNSDSDVWAIVEEAMVEFVIKFEPTMDDMCERHGRVGISQTTANAGDPLLPSVTDALLDTIYNEDGHDTFLRWNDYLFVIRWIGSPTIEWSPSLQDRFSELGGLTSQGHQEFQFNRVRVTRTVSVWALFLWGTAWLHRICSCGIHNLQIGSDRKCPAVAPNEDQPCHQSVPSPAVMLLLGRLLAELGLAKIIHLDFDHGQPQFLVGSDSLKDYELLARLQDKRLRLPPSYTEAIRFCIDHGSRLEREELDIDIINQYTRLILEP